MKRYVKSLAYVFYISPSMKSFGPVIYCLLASFATICFSMVIARLFGLPNYDAIPIFSAIRESLMVGIIETMLFQALPFHFTRSRFSVLIQFLAMTLPFGIAHFENGIAGVVNGIIVGAIFSFSYLTWSRFTVLAAITMTSAIHIIHNAVLLAI